MLNGQLKYYPNILLISGNGKNVGKTTFSCQLIEHLQCSEIIGVKISPHFHAYNDDDKVLIKNEKFILIEELKTDTGKDSSKLLKSGAKRVFFLMVLDNNLQEAFEHLLEYFDNSAPIIIESAALRNIIKPGLFLLLSRFDHLEPKDSMRHLIKFVDINVVLHETNFDFLPSKLFLSNENKWMISN